MDKNEINQQFLQERFKYRDGHLWWVKVSKYASTVKAGQQFGCYDSSGYRVGTLKGKLYKEHRLIWLYHYGEWPKECIDHINGVRDDNRIENLREVTTQQNNFNRKSAKGSSSKYKGVSWYKQHKKWRVRYRYNGRQCYVGLYETELEAAEAYDKAVEHLHGEYQVKNV